MRERAADRALTRARRGIAAGLVLAAAGSALVAHAVSGQVSERLVQRRLARALASGQPRWVEAGGLAVLPALRLEMPAIGLDTVAVVAPAGGAGDEALAAGPVVSEPREGGPLVLSAHRDAHFRPLERARVGQEIRLTGRLGARRYVVTDLRVVLPSDVSALAELGPDDLVLSTCWPFQVLGPAPKRLLVVASKTPWRHPPVASNVVTRGGRSG